MYYMMRDEWRHLIFLTADEAAGLEITRDTTYRKSLGSNICDFGTSDAANAAKEALRDKISAALGVDPIITIVIDVENCCGPDDAKYMMSITDAASTKTLRPVYQLPTLENPALRYTLILLAGLYDPSVDADDMRIVRLASRVYDRAEYLKLAEFAQHNGIREISVDQSLHMI